ncbi:hypothetical protein LN650_23480 [Klebsiella pneumoniae subsp. pneumoniae]|nr:hypothetical protein [Klebsiella pneumoniae subsp. pneumoniae]
MVNKGGVRKASITASSACLQAGCPTAESIYVRASPLQRTRATAQALVDGAFPGCSVAIHYVSGDAGPLFQTDKFAATQADPARQLAAVEKRPGIWRSVGGRWRRPSSY